MNTLKISTRSIGEEGHVFEESAAVASIQPPDTQPPAIKTVSINGQFTRMGDEFLFRGRITGEFMDACSRCLTPTRAPMTVEVDWVFVEGPTAVFEEVGHLMEMDETTALDAPSPEESRRAFQGGEINLAPYVWEEIVFAAPSRYLCDESCRGLCPQCGENLNEFACECAARRREEQIGNRGLAGLAQLFPELAPERSKE